MMKGRIKLRNLYRFYFAFKPMKIATNSELKHAKHLSTELGIGIGSKAKWNECSW